jgi:hypothetical protein
MIIMMNKLIHAMEEKDYVALSNLFADKCHYFDYMPAGIGERNYHVCGRKGIGMFFHNKFYFKGFEIFNAVVENDRVANCFALYHGRTLHAKIEIAAIDEEGKIVNMVISPASGPTIYV